MQLYDPIRDRNGLMKHRNRIVTCLPNGYTTKDVMELIEAEILPCVTNLLASIDLHSTPFCQHLRPFRSLDCQLGAAVKLLDLAMSAVTPDRVRLHLPMN